MTLEEITDKNKLALDEFECVEKLKFPSLELPDFIKTEEFGIESIWKKNDLSFGDHILYQIVYKDPETSKMMMSYPKMAIFTSYNIADQALVYEMVSPIRSWEYKFEPKEGYFYSTTHITSHIEWYDIIYIFGIWKNKPNWKEMKKAYRQTFYFRTDRKTKIKRALNSK